MFNMKLRRTVTRCIALMVALAVTGCNLMTLLPESKKMDYKSAGKLPPLEVPPDLTAPGTDERYIVPDINPSGSATYSAYNKERTGKPGAGSTSLLPASDDSGARIERAGTQRWLVVKGEPEAVWPIVKEFWQELGFIINVETPTAGVMETDWAENRANIPQDIIRSILSKVLDSLYSTGQRDKFRTRLERGEATARVVAAPSRRRLHGPHAPASRARGSPPSPVRARVRGAGPLPERTRRDAPTPR